MVKKLVKTAFVLLVGFCLTGCGSSPKQATASCPKIVSTTAMIDDMIKHIVADKMQTDCLIKGDIDPHSYELVKGDQAKLRSASLIFYQGLGLEHGASLVNFLHNTPKARALGSDLSANHSEKLIYHAGYLDPHVWLDLDLWKNLVPIAASEIINLDPQNRDFYLANAQKYLEEMDLLDQKIQNLLLEIPESKRYLVTSHSAFSYFTRRYIAQSPDWQDRCIAPEGLAPEAQVSLYDIEKVVSYIQANNISTIFSESNVSKDVIMKILDVCKKTGVSVELASQPLFGDALFDEKGYLDMMWHNATLLHQAWHGQAPQIKD